MRQWKEVGSFLSEYAMITFVSLLAGRKSLASAQEAAKPAVYTQPIVFSAYKRKLKKRIGLTCDMQGLSNLSP
jgi:hypothetical protein